jgi:hypothetical protein
MDSPLDLGEEKECNSQVSLFTVGHSAAFLDTLQKLIFLDPPPTLHPPPRHLDRRRTISTSPTGIKRDLFQRSLAVYTCICRNTVHMSALYRLSESDRKPLPVITIKRQLENRGHCKGVVSSDLRVRMRRKRKIENICESAKVEN